MSYFLGIVAAAYGEFESRVDVVSGGRGSKRQAVREFVRSNVSDEFTVADVRRAVPTASDVYIREQLRALKREDVLVQQGAGPNARWVRLHIDF